ncbi:hypothetical protein DFH06DRAFT_1322029 [Mycena polygramma]|nr:hypothetical protein DFH06DRAFT_1322029 [Mycena polygramma]
MYHLVRGSPGVRAILVKYWRALVDNHGTVVHEGFVSNPDGWGDIHSILVFLAKDESPESDSTSPLEEMSDGVGSSTRNLTRLFVEQMDDATAHYESRPNTAGPVLSALVLLMTGAGSEDFYEALLSDGVVSFLIKAVRVLEDCARGDESFRPVLALSFDLLASRFRSDSGHRWVVQALDAGLLDLIITLGPSTHPTGTLVQVLTQLLRKDFPGYLVYYQVALRIKRHFPRAHSMAASPAFRTSAIADLWTDFSKLVEENLGVLNYFESKTCRSAKACENMEVCPCQVHCLLLTSGSAYESPGKLDSKAALVAALPTIAPRSAREVIGPSVTDIGVES